MTELKALVLKALDTVHDPEIGMPITKLGMVDSLEISEDGNVAIRIVLTTAGCPLKDKISQDIAHALQDIPGITGLSLAMGVMSEEQRNKIGELVRGSRPALPPTNPIPFVQPGNTTKVIAIASGKGGVGKSSVTTNIACALAAKGLDVGVMDADVWGYSIPRMLGVTGQPVQFEGMMMPLQNHGVKVMSIGFFTEPDSPVIWRGPMLHRAMQQFLGDVHWGDIDVLLVDLPPGTGDIALSMAQLLPNADMLVVTTPQTAAQRVAIRAGKITEKTGMNVIGVIENMATFIAPDTNKEYDIFGTGGGQSLADELGTELWASLPLTQDLREGGDKGLPIVIAQPESVTAQRFNEIADRIIARKKTLVKAQLPVF